ncbi:PAS domain-containing sensor histidine kinase [Desulfosarcina widdelii]|uniref:histidine kinase n=1 Tax=Desulfosarcina widdelii TaxID=947919 RepID=A0A5K7ZC88_9BACT|nr:ATP-binding protein [Desulfosarcina widdelii]BBO77351.1 PAS domain-containing sensor histidine kinase [Desulfosarcina widdelii]
MMKDKASYRPFLSGFSPWIVLGALAVLLPVVAMMTIETLNRQKRQSTQLLMEKGAALIRSFEAGTRMGMHGGHGRDFKLQRLLAETAAQPDIAYLLVVRTDGVVIAHSQIDKVGSSYGSDLDLPAIHASAALRSRQGVSEDGSGVFEVFGRFAPLARPPVWMRRSHRMGRGEMITDLPTPPEMVIFVGLRTDSVDAARAADTRHTIVMAAVLLLAGCAGVLLLLLAQNYRSARTSLVRVQAFSDNLVTRMPIGLVALDRDNRVTAVNSVARATLGLDADEAVGQPADRVIPAELLNPLDDTDEPVQREVVCPVADGRQIPLDVNAATLTDDSGERFGRVILFKDLSEIRTLRLELEKNRRLASVGRLAAGVAHEIRNPLSSIKGFATYFKEKYRQEEKDQEIAAIMIQEVDRLNRVVGQLLEFARPLRLVCQSVAVKPLLEDAIQLVAQQSKEANVELIPNLSDATLHATMDADKMRQVVLNLLLNALDAMPEGGTLHVSAAGVGKNGLQLTVADTGKGIDPDDRPHIFEPYFSTKKTGTGLGLAIVHNIVKAHNGEIRVKSRSGEGTTVSITLPENMEA